MKNTISILAATSSLALLSACGGTSTSPVITTPITPTAPSYETLSSTAAVTSTLGGVAIRSNGTSGALDVVTISGTTTHNTGNTTITDGTYSLTDADGFNGGTTLTDGTSTITVDGTQGFTGTYEYVTAYEQTYTAGGTTYDSIGIGGVITNTSDVPTSGNATYTGEAAALVVTATQGLDLNDGTSSVSADFASGTVTATLTGFTATDQTTGNTATAPIDTISATGMTIAGNGFSGGTVTTTNGGAAVNITGANTATAAQGAFFGYDATNSTPDEVGGLILQQGDDGIVAGGFIAD